MVRQRSKPCAHCQTPASTLFRVRYAAEANPESNTDWIFVCEACFPELKQHHPDYIYGGTWKAVKK